jgi:valyl-tRNA synthetase
MCDRTRRQHPRRRRRPNSSCSPNATAPSLRKLRHVAEPTCPDTEPLPPVFEPAGVEAPLYERWIERGYFEADDNSDRPPFCIVIPPPNVTGSLHIGHAFEHTLMDALVRRRRMQGYEALWLTGMDHAGIATQNVVERELAKQGLSRHDLGREAFVEKVWEWKAESGGLILKQMRRLGDGVAWSRERFTMDDGLSRAVQEIFKRLYDDGLIYRAERIINWCVRCHTALSDIEVEHSEDEGELVFIRYGDPQTSEVVVATTRAETMLGDTAVAVHPDDERYAHLVGTEVELPLTGRRIPVVADSKLDPAFGTGMVKVTPGHDRTTSRSASATGCPACWCWMSRAPSLHTARSRDWIGWRPGRRLLPPFGRRGGSSRSSDRTCMLSATVLDAAQ